MRATSSTRHWRSTRTIKPRCAHALDGWKDPEELRMPVPTFGLTHFALAVRVASPRLREDRSAWRCRHHLWPLRRALQERGSWTQTVHGVVSARVREARQTMAV